METTNEKTLNTATDSSSGAQDAKQDKGGSSPSSNGTGAKVEYNPLAIATRIAEQTPGGGDEQVDEGSEKEKVQEKADASGGVLKKNETEGEADQAVGDEETQTDGEKTEEEKGKKEDEVALDDKANAEDTRFDKHPRFQKLLGENKELKPLADSARAVNGYCEQHGITTQQFNAALEMAAFMNVDPMKAREAMRPYWESLQAYAGETLPKDLQEKVDAGKIEVSDAKEIAKLRQQSTMGERKTQAQTQAQGQAANTQALHSWETTTRAKNPDYDKVFPLVKDAYIARMANVTNPNPQACVKAAQEALDSVMKSLAPYTVAKAPASQKRLQVNGSGKKHEEVTLPGTDKPMERMLAIANGIAAKHRSDA